MKDKYAILGMHGSAMQRAAMEAGARFQGYNTKEIYVRPDSKEDEARFYEELRDGRLRQLVLMNLNLGSSGDDSTPFFRAMATLWTPIELGLTNLVGFSGDSEKNKRLKRVLGQFISQEIMMEF